MSDVWSAVEQDAEISGRGNRMINPANLLTTSDLEKPTTAPCGEPTEGNGDAAPKKKRACKNCTCGLAKLEAEEVASEAEASSTAGAKSACGNVSILPSFIQITFFTESGSTYRSHLKIKQFIISSS